MANTYSQYGVREIADIVFKARSRKKIGNKIFEKGEPVMYFDSAKTSSLESTTNTVYAQGGKGNPRLVSWEGDKTVTFKFTDALISPQGFSILSGADLIEGSTVTRQRNADIYPTKGTDGGLYLVLPENAKMAAVREETDKFPEIKIHVMELDTDGNLTGKTIPVNKSGESADTKLTLKQNSEKTTYVLADAYKKSRKAPLLKEDMQYRVDYYVDVAGSEMSIDPGKFATNFLIEATTLFRRKTDGKDLEAQFVIPNGKVQSGFTFTMAATGDPSAFDFTVDAFPGYLPYDHTRKVMAALNIVDDEVALDSLSYTPVTTVGTADSAMSEAGE